MRRFFQSPESRKAPASASESGIIAARFLNKRNTAFEHAMEPLP